MSNILVTQGTTTAVATDLVGTSHYQVIKLDVGGTGASSAFTGTLADLSNLAKGTITKVEGGTVGLITRVGNLGTIESGSVIVTSGTQNTLGTVGVVNNGTLALVTRTGNVGTIESGSVVMTAGTVSVLNTVGTVGVVNNLANGTLAAVTTVTNLTSGSVRMTVGTVTTGSLSNVAMLNAGTITTIPNIPGGTIGLVSNLASGTLAVVTSLANVAGGTVQHNPVPVPSMLSHGTLGTAGGSFFGTLSAASGAGTKHYISGLSVVQQSGTSDVRILMGTGIQGTGVLSAGFFSPSGGMVREFNPPMVTGTNSELTYHFVGAGTAFITIQYWKGT